MVKIRFLELNETVWGIEIVGYDEKRNLEYVYTISSRLNHKEFWSRLKTKMNLKEEREWFYLIRPPIYRQLLDDILKETENDMWLELWGLTKETKGGKVKKEYLGALKEIMGVKEEIKEARVKYRIVDADRGIKPMAEIKIEWIDKNGELHHWYDYDCVEFYDRYLEYER